ncbi:MAG: competence/damage-inducible protein A [Alphaproteobacteria bacterium]|nr:competence/damage-inducible protein A [Alphaproteobacteria bacterium]
MTAAALVIGNEILSGRTVDANVSYLGRRLNELGIQLKEVRVVADDVAAIVEAVNALRRVHDYLFTTGGIGPTHDDITAGCIAEAFGVKLVRHPDAVKLITDFVVARGRELTEARLKMAEVADGATLIENEISAAPGFRIENVFVMAGIPKVMQAMFEVLAPDLEGGVVLSSRTVTTHIPEGVLAPTLGSLQDIFDDCDVGSYPFLEEGQLGVNVVIRGPDEGRLDAAVAQLEEMLAALGADAVRG